MSNQKVVSLGELSGVGATAWVPLNTSDSVAKVHSTQVSSKGTVSAATVELEYSLDKLGALPLQSITLDSSTTSDGAIAESTLAVYMRMRVTAITGGGSVVGSVVVGEG